MADGIGAEQRSMQSRRLLLRASPPVNWNELTTAGLLAHGFASSPDLPAISLRSGMTLFKKSANGFDNPLTVAGAATASDRNPHRIPYYSSRLLARNRRDQIDGMRPRGQASLLLCYYILYYKVVFSLGFTSPAIITRKAGNLFPALIAKRSAVLRAACRQ